MLAAMPKWREMTTNALMVVGICCALLILTIVIVGFSAPRLPLFPANRWIALVVTGLSVALVGIFTQTQAREPVRQGRSIAAALGVVAAIVTFIVARGSQYDVRWDASLVWDEAGRHADNGEPSESAMSYLTRHVNNRVLYGVALAAHRYFGEPEDVFLVISALGVGIVVAVICASLFSWGARIVHVVIAALWITFLLGANTALAIHYTDVLVFAVPVLTVALMMRAIDYQRSAVQLRYWFIWAALAGLVVGWGIAARALPIVLLPGIVLAVVWIFAARRSDRDERRRAIVAVATLLVVAGSTAWVVVQANNRVIDIPLVDNKAQSPWVYVWQGAREQVTQPDENRAWLTTYGAWDLEINQATEGKTTTEVEEMAKAGLAAHYSALGPRGVVKFYANKFLWICHDGMFWSWGGPDATTTPTPKGPLDATSFNSPTGALWQWHIDLAQGTWFAVLVLAAFTILRNAVRCWSNPAGPLVITLLSIVIGALAFIMTFEGRPRYLFIFVPLIIWLAMLPRPQLPHRNNLYWFR